MRVAFVGCFTVVACLLVVVMIFAVSSSSRPAYRDKYSVACQNWVRSGTNRDGSPVYRMQNTCR